MTNMVIKKIFLALLLLVSLVSCQKQDAAPEVKSIDDLKGTTIGVQLGTTADVLASEYEKKGEGAKVERFTKTADAIQALKQGKIGCVIVDEVPGKAFLRKNQGMRILPQTFGESGFAICIAKGNEELLKQCNQAILKLKQSGLLDSISSRHMDREMAVAYEPQQVKHSRGKIRFATNATFEPFEYYKDGKIVGIDVDVARALGDVLDMDVEVVDMEFDAIITSVQTGKADAGIAGMTVTEERKKNINFSEPYAYERQVVIVNDKSNAASMGEGQSLKEKFKSCFVTEHRYQYLVKGLCNTLLITFFAIILSLILGTMIAIVRATHERNHTHPVLNAICQVYLTIVRGTPTMVQLLIIYYVVFASADVNKIVLAVIAFGLNSAAYIAEVIRSGIMSVDRGQMEAGRSLGLSYSKTMRLVILPQAFKNVMPAMGNELITLLKETSISGYIGLVDLTKGSDIIRSITYEAMLPLGIVACIYLLIVAALYLGVQKLEKHLRRTERR